ncbi:BMP family lipoprotein [Paeniglutamicibacter kerguelensis]|uniref:Basic membrane protein A n=1 Tax=Paeniglutamicibacter kerguelensis TaxID=254788 RepID=A0ABS4XJD1_9MICC|nr:BMP family protein [Paeniglutamicibacter kerguelensis]MBP2388388.1 basic membrane protein A [Paeniglutamicibacter kerguelensis]
MASTPTIAHLSTQKLLSAMALGMGLSISLTACGGQAPASTAATNSGLKVGIFVDNAFGDGDFFDQAGIAVEPLESDLGATVKTYEGQLQAQNFAPLLQDAADANDLVFVLGFEAIDAMTEVADRNKDTTFVFVDGKVDSPEALSAEFRTAEGCFMAGALAAAVGEDASAVSTGFIGGVNAPVVKNCEGGFTAGVSNVAPDMKVLAQYVGSFTDPSKGREVALGLETRGARSVFAYAGLSGAGAFDAAKSGSSIAPVGIVADKSALAPGKVPGSLIMRVDKVITSMAKDFSDGKLKHGEQRSYGFAEDGWEMLYDDKLVPAERVKELEALQAKLVSGAVSPDAK